MCIYVFISYICIFAYGCFCGSMLRPREQISKKSGSCNRQFLALQKVKACPFCVLEERTQGSKQEIIPV